MNSTYILPSAAASLPGRVQLSSSGSVVDALQSRFALGVAARLTEGCESISLEITERLRFAREQALAGARAARSAAGPLSVPAGRSRGAVLGGSGAGWRLKFAGVIPVLALVGGLVLIEQWQDNAQVAVAAEIDAALLSDDLPPTAYSDAGFVEYLKTPHE